LGAIAVTVGVTWRIPDLAVAGAALLLLGLALLVMALAGLQRRSLQRAPWAARWYYACAAFLAFGVVAGALLATGASWRYGSLLGAHLVLNLAGWFGTAIVGTLHTFFPSLTHTRLRFPALQQVAFAGWIGGTAVLACGYGLDTAAAVAAGWIGLCIGASAMATNLLASVRNATEALPLPARLVAVGQCFLVVGLVVGLLATLAQGPDGPLWGPERSALAVLLLAGWLGMTVLGSLLQLLSVLARVRNLGRVLPQRRARGDAAPPVLAALGVFGLAAGLLLPVEPLMGPATGVLALTYAVLMVRVTGLAVRAIRHGELRI
ncbi:MAG TPA: hypothetical protein VFD39_09330, partial [Trueperaceae bacterium]|nr:hypothetical protein [Trueperaceae bacterium]